MGVPGLWEIVNKASHSRSLANLAIVDGFQRNDSGIRALRIGIDVSLWYQHTPFSKGGANPEIRLLFFRLANLSQLPVLPLFVFDGRERPQIKRGSKMGKAGSHHLTQGFKKLLDHFGMEWRMAPGEAEAELAYLNRKGIIDAVMTDDVDALIFGARTIIKNPSLSLSGNKSNPALNSEGKPSKDHGMVCKIEDVAGHPLVGMSRGGLILFALLSGGDYDAGVKGCGPQLAHSLAQCEFGDELLRAFELRQREDIRLFLITWRNRINAELRTNSRGRLPRKAPSVVLPSDFPDLQVLKYYAEPLTSGTRGVSGGPIRDNSDLSLPRVAGFCEEHFDEWGHRSMIIKRFRDLLWESALMRVMRRAALEADLQEKNQRVAAGRTDLAIRGPLTPSIEQGIGTPAALVNRYLNPAMVDRIAEAFVNRGPQVGPNVSNPNLPDTHPLVVKIVGTRRHVSTDHMLEYRLEIDPHQFVDLTNSGITGSRPDPPPSNRPGEEEVDNILEPSQSALKTPKKPPPDRYSIIRVWFAASIVRQVHPKLVKDFEDAEAAKNAPKSTPSPKRRKGKEKATEADPEEEEEGLAAWRSPAKCATKSTPVPSRKGKERARYVEIEDEDERPAAPPPRLPAPQLPSQLPPPPPPTVLQAASQEVRRSIEPIRTQLLPSQPSQLPPSQPLEYLPSQPTRIPRRKARLEIPVESESSLPQRVCGFIFTFPHPDNPDHILTEEEEEEEEDALGPLEYQRRHVPSTPPITQLAPANASVRSRFEDIYNQILAVAASAPEAGPSQPRTRTLEPPQVVSETLPTPRLSQPKPRPRPRASLPVAVPPPPSWPSVASPSATVSGPAPVVEDEEEEAPISQFDAMIDDLLGVGNNRGKGKRKAAPKRARKNPTGSQRPPKRQRTTSDRDTPVAATVAITPPPCLPLPLPLPPPTPTPRVLAPFPDMPPLDNLPPVPSLAPSPAPNPRKRPIPVDASITSVHSDDEYPAVAPPPRKRRPIPISGSIISIHSDDDEGPGTSTLASSSRVGPVSQGLVRTQTTDIHLNVPEVFQLRRGLLQDVDDVIDLI